MSAGTDLCLRLSGVILDPPRVIDLMDEFKQLSGRYEPGVRSLGHFDPAVQSLTITHNTGARLPEGLWQ